MKRISFCIFTLAFFTGCIVTSVSPFYTQNDLVTDSALPGDWIREIKDNPAEVWKFEALGDRGYRLTLIEERSATVLEAKLFKLRDQLFLELASMEQDYHVIPPHYLLRITQLKPQLHLSQLSHDWLKELLGKDPTAIRHHFVQVGRNADERRVVLTANTPELQSFVLKHLDNENAWKADFELKRGR